jgi:hypothetical protein
MLGAAVRGHFLSTFPNPDGGSAKAARRHARRASAELGFGQLPGIQTALIEPRPTRTAPTRSAPEQNNKAGYYLGTPKKIFAFFFAK